MKKLFSIFCVFTLILCVFSASACGMQRDENAVNLISINISQVGSATDIDYFVVPEPAASARVKAIEDLNFVGNLQSLYGGENGYPQAVIVAKNKLLDTDILNQFITEISSSSDWLMSDENSTGKIVESIQSHLTSGLTPSINEQNLTVDVIKNCGVKFVSATESKSSIITFMEKFNAIGEQSFGIPTDEFFYTGSGTEEYSQKISVYAPDGAPALGLAKLMAEGVLDNTEYHIVDANSIQTLVSGENPKADICVLPVNLAVKLLGNAQNYKLIGTLTHGNLYILSKNNIQISVDNLSELIGKRVGVINLAQVPGLTFKLILKNYGIKFSEPYND